MLHFTHSTAPNVRCWLKTGLAAVAKIAGCCALFVVVCLPSRFELLAQNSSTGEITGLVTDNSGSVVPGAEVTVVNEETQVVTAVKTAGTGNYNVPFLPLGHYQVTVVHPGFETFKRSHIEIGQVDQAVRLDAMLAVGATSQVVNVTANQSQLQTETSDVSLNFSNTLVDNLPLVGRNYLFLADLAPGTSDAQSAIYNGNPSNSSSQIYNVNGNRDFTVNALLNGGSLILPDSNNIGDNPAMAAVSEFSLVLSNFSAEYGTGTSVLNIVSKSGTNQFHGTAFDYLENAALNATQGFATTKPALHYNQFGGALGGPVIRRKLFFFFSYQNTLSPQSSSAIYTTPTAAMLAGNFSQFSTPIIDPNTGQPFPGNMIPAARFDAVANNLHSYWPAPNYGASGATSNNFIFLTPSSPKTPIYDYKGDWTINAANQLSFTGHYSPTSTDFTGGAPLSPACYLTQRCGSTFGDESFYQTMEKWVVNSHMVNAGYFSIIHEHYGENNPTVGKNYPSMLGFPAGGSTPLPLLLPIFTINGGVTTGLGPGGFEGAMQTSFTYSDVLTWVEGNHNLSAGGQFYNAQLNYPILPVAPNFGFNGQYTGNGFADFLLGQVQSYTYNNVMLDQFDERRTAGAAFLQDNWRIWPTFTLNVGMRYQYEGGWYEAHNRNSNFSPTAINPATQTPGAIVFASPSHRLLQQDHPALFAPRIGFSKELGQKTVVRAGYGLFYQMSSGEDQTNTAPPGYAIQQTLVAQTVTTPEIFQLQNGPPAYVVPTAASRTGDILNGQTIAWWPFNSRQPYSQEWNLALQRQLGNETTAQITYVGTVGRHLLTYYDVNQVPTALLGTPLDQTNPQAVRPFPQYQGIGTTSNFGYSSYNSLQIAVQRRFAHGFSYFANYTYSKSIDNSSDDSTNWSGNDYQDAAALPTAASDFNEPHRGVVGYVYDLPVGQGRMLLNRGGILDRVIGGWTTSGNFTVHSGYPFTILASPPNLTGSLSGVVTGNVFADRVAHLPSPKSALEWFNPANFASPAPYTFGDSGRNTNISPGYWDYDADLKKTFSLYEGVNLQVRGDAFNVFNHRNLTAPDATLGTTGTGQITASTTARILQVGAQINF
jgi:hypothetical protein